MHLDSTVVVGVLCVACESRGMNGCDDTIHNTEIAPSVFVQGPSFITEYSASIALLKT